MTQLTTSSVMPARTGTEWWRDAVIYQVYPRSFADSDGDGMGDLPGVTARLPYLAALGVDAIWLSPFYVSPQADAGYDVADYRDIDPVFGTLADADALLAAAAAHGIKVLVDLVPNHTSDEHPWFVQAVAAGAGSTERDRYVFRDGHGPGGDLPPNNWRSVFGGGAWNRVVEPDGAPGQWYLHIFDAKQPDLNWEHPQAAVVRGRHQRVEVLERAELRIDRGVIRDVVAEVLHRRAVDRRQPHPADAEPREVVEPARDSPQVPHSVAVGVRERPRIHLVDHAVAPPAHGRRWYGAQRAARARCRRSSAAAALCSSRRIRSGLIGLDAYARAR